MTVSQAAQQIIESAQQLQAEDGTSVKDRLKFHLNHYLSSDQ